MSVGVSMVRVLWEGLWVKVKGLGLVMSGCMSTPLHRSVLFSVML